MKKLFLNINDVRIRGAEGAALLGEGVTAMDKTMETITIDTQELTRIIHRHFETNKGDQYKKMVDACIELSKKLVEASREMNDFQHQIANLQAKIFRYEDQKREPTKARVSGVEELKLDVSTNETYYTLDSITAVYKALIDYSNKTNENLKRLVNTKNEMRSVWFDTQYNNFSAFIEDLRNEIIKHIKVFLTYAEYLKKKINELHSGQ